jgi:signal transduction histidine kinase
VKPDETVIVLGMKMEAGFLGLVGRPRGPIFLFFLVASTAAGVLLAWALGVRSRLLEAALDRSRSERNHLEEFGLTAAGLAHETKNPLGIILGLAQRISRHPEDPEKVREMAVQIQDAADRATARLGEFLSFARLEEPRLALRDGREILERAVEALRPDFEERRVALALETDHLEFLCDAEMTTQVVVNLLLNALHACEPGGRVVVRLERVGSRVGRLRVLDNGKGIPEELRDRVFQPYVTGSSEGHGLGLAIVSRIARAHGWQVELLSSPGSGTTVTIEGLRGDQE